MCFLWKLCSCLNQYCCTWYPGSAAPQKTLFSWFMLKPFIENSKKSNYSLTKKKSLQLSLEEYSSKKSLIGLPLSLKTSHIPSTLKSSFLHYHRYCHSKAIPPPHSKQRQLTFFPSYFTAIVFFWQIVFDYQAAVIFLYIHIWQRQGENPFAFTPDFILCSRIFASSTLGSVRVTEGKTCYCSLNQHSLKTPKQSLLSSGNQIRLLPYRYTFLFHPRKMKLRGIKLVQTFIELYLQHI